MTSCDENELIGVELCAKPKLDNPPMLLEVDAACPPQIPERGGDEALGSSGFKDPIRDDTNSSSWLLLPEPPNTPGIKLLSGIEKPGMDAVTPGIGDLGALYGGADDALFIPMLGVVLLSKVGRIEYEESKVFPEADCGGNIEKLG